MTWIWISIGVAVLSGLVVRAERTARRRADQRKRALQRPPRKWLATVIEVRLAETEKEKFQFARVSNHPRDTIPYPLDVEGYHPKLTTLDGRSLDLDEHTRVTWYVNARTETRSMGMSDFGDPTDNIDFFLSTNTRLWLASAELVRTDNERAKAPPIDARYWISDAPIYVPDAPRSRRWPLALLPVPAVLAAIGLVAKSDLQPQQFLTLIAVPAIVTEMAITWVVGWCEPDF